MTAHIGFVLYLLLTIVIFPLVMFNFIIINTGLIPSMKPFIITTDSMSPVIPEGSLVYTLGSNSYKKGEVIAFIDSIGKVTHRIIKKVNVSGSEYYVTKGDKNSIIDNEIIPQQNIYGKIIMVIPYLGSLIISIKSISAVILGTVLPTLFLLFIPALVIIKSKV